ncbi:MAG: hypothetical protein BLM47_09405 [Candidatus Reconcilbacillus cellulovorans]|uniref:DUF4304 domain-containing protein n=1 Tax=Candidatus Reconcilbacillus cellulovorans TaxID=1906605 RepID=A0A2A6DYQ5_9BACL|nr:MAG: hypothetical protein BLM47_09405 [Candidatus Reconcilbacillus cellulovorans]
MSIIQEWKKNFVAPLLKQHGFLMKQGEFIYKTDSVSRIIAVTPYRFNPENFIIEYGVHRSTIPLFSTLETIDRPKLYHCQIKTYVRDKKGHGMLFNAGKWIPKRQDELKSILLNVVAQTEDWSDPRKFISMILNDDPLIPYGPLYKKVLLIYLYLECGEREKALSVASTTNVNGLEEHEAAVWSKALQALAAGMSS